MELNEHQKRTSVYHVLLRNLRKVLFAWPPTASRMQTQCSSDASVMITISSFFHIAETCRSLNGEYIWAERGDEHKNEHQLAGGWWFSPQECANRALAHNFPYGSMLHIKL